MYNLKIPDELVSELEPEIKRITDRVTQNNADIELDKQRRREKERDDKHSKRMELEATKAEHRRTRDAERAAQKAADRESRRHAPRRRDRGVPFMVDQALKTRVKDGGVMNMDQLHAAVGIWCNETGHRFTRNLSPPTLWEAVDPSIIKDDVIVGYEL